MKYLTNIKAYAKVNFILNVLGTMEGGYHRIESIMQAVDLYDDVQVSWTTDRAARFTVKLEPGRPDLPSDDRNLAYRAAVLMHDAFHEGENESISIIITKRIPMAAGLAGGSADGAAVITALARLWDIEDKETLMSLAAKLGSDVPFCYMAQNGSPAALAEGRGTELTPVAPVDCRLLISTPSIAVPTREVYGELQDEDCVQRHSVSGFLKAADLKSRTGYMGNHLEAPALRLYPGIAGRMDELECYEAPLYTQMSGSGPTVFSVYPPDKTLSLKGLELEGSTFSVRTVLKSGDY